MKISRVAVLLIIALSGIGCSLANAQSPKNQKARLLVVFLEEQAERVLEEEDRGVFEITFMAASTHGRLCFSRSIVRDEHFMVLMGGQPTTISVAAIDVSLALPRGVDPSPADTAAEYCLANRQTRIFRLLVSLKSPQQAGAFSVRLLSVGDGKVKAELLPSPAAFVTSMIFINDKDADN